ncbi:hypothetical protein [Brevundimonas sp.]|jgi:hypothetical protein|uniref:hypothetical protein n=1 Tax=Brevundimonas sp. TaxID=1871086 RepID=UPI002FC67A5D
MSKLDATATFLYQWVSENINAGPYDPGDAVINPLAEQLVRDAAAEGITVEDMAEVRGTPYEIVETALDEATDNEVERLASKDD